MSTQTSTPGGAIDNLAHSLVTRGITDPKNYGAERVAERVMYADAIARDCLEKMGTDETAPDYHTLFAAIVHQRYRALLDHALAWADFQVELHRAGPGDQWQILSQNDGGAWSANPIGPREVAEGGYAIEVALRGIVIHLEREGYGLENLDMQRVFNAIDEHVSTLAPEQSFLRPARLARVGLRGVDLSSHIY